LKREWETYATFWTRGNSKVKNDKRDRLEKQEHKFRKIAETLISKVSIAS